MRHDLDRLADGFDAVIERGEDVRVQIDEAHGCGGRF